MDKKKITIAVVAVVAVIAIAIIVFLLTKDTNTIYTISFNTNGGEKVVSQEIEEGKTATKPNNPTKEGYEFLGWYLNGEKFNFETPIEKDVTLEAKWKEVVKDEEPDKNDEENKDNEVVEDNKDDEKEDEEETTKVTKYTVKFDSNGGSKVTSKTVEKNKTVKAPTDPTREGYKFLGWYLGNTKYNFSKKVTKNITLTAKWEKVEEEKPSQPDTPVTPDEPDEPITPEVKEYTVKFDVDGKVTTKTVKEGEKVAEPSKPTKDSYTFKGWYLDGKEFDFSTKISKDITLKAEWSKNKVVTWDYEEEDWSYAKQIRVFVFEDGKKVAGTVDITYTNGVTETTNIPVEGYLIPKTIYKSISNPKVK